jgi:diketogulonate reductase-like aldo/keto reductase
MVPVWVPCLQVLIRWALGRGCSVLPKSTNPERIAANLAVSDWQLAAEDVQALSSLPYRVCALVLSSLQVWPYCSYDVTLQTR